MHETDKLMESSPYLRRNILNGVFHYLIGRGMSGVAGIASVILLARSMNVEAYAGYTTLTGMAMMVSLLSTLGLERAVARYVPEGRMHHTASQLSHLIWRLCLIRLIVALFLTIVIVLLWSQMTQLFLGSLNIEHFPWFIACFFLASVISEYLSYVLQSLVLQKILTRILVVQWGGRLAIISMIIYFHTSISLDQALWIMAIPEMCVALLMAVVLRHYLKALRSKEVPIVDDGKSWPPWSDVYQMAIYNYIYILIVLIPQGTFMRLVVAATLPTEFVAAYGFFLTLFERIRNYLPVQFLYAIIEPTLISAFIDKKDFSKMNNHIKFLLDVNMYVIIGILSVYGLLHTEIIGVASGHKYSEYDWIFCILLIQLAWMTNSQLMILAVNAVGKSHILILPSLLSLSITLLYLYYSSQYFKEFIILAPLLFYSTNNIFVGSVLRYSGIKYNISISRTIVFILFSLLLTGLAANSYGFLSIGTTLYFNGIMSLSYYYYKLIIVLFVIIIGFNIFISHDNILFVKEYLSLKRRSKS